MNILSIMYIIKSFVFITCFLLYCPIYASQIEKNIAPNNTNNSNDNNILKDDEILQRYEKEYKKHRDDKYWNLEYANFLISKQKIDKAITILVPFLEPHQVIPSLYQETKELIEFLTISFIPHESESPSPILVQKEDIDIEITHALANAYYIKGEYQSSIPLLRDILIADSENITLQYQYADMLSRYGAFNIAINCYNSLLKRNFSPDFLLGKAETYIRSSNALQAINILTSLQDILTKRFYIFHKNYIHQLKLKISTILAKSYTSLREYTKAIREYSVILELNPEDLHTRYNLAKLLSDSNLVQPAIAQYQLYIKMAPIDLNAIIEYITLLIQINENKEALSILSKFLGINIIPSFSELDDIEEQSYRLTKEHLVKMQELYILASINLEEWKDLLKVVDKFAKENNFVGDVLLNILNKNENRIPQSYYNKMYKQYVSKSK